ncbi:homing endonuclease [Bacillus phage Bcp1]|uniref:Putative group 1 intron n=1 Tax=Bacillus phage Bcp1 TaxID=584892 RepID=X2JLE0_9CAUD|nr:homing endonuclease [Bacillus phage Bcp1]AHN66660.1 putative group 1 intron [Bacillus phage Bcp1]
MQTLHLDDKKRYAKERGYTLLAEENFNRNTTVIVRKDSNGYEYTVHWSSFRAGAEPVRTTFETKCKQAKERGYTLLETENFGINEKVKLQNDDTEEVYEVKFTDFLHKGYREKSQTVISKGEAVIKAYLETNIKEGFRFRYQHRVDLDNKKLYYDFSILDRSDNVIGFIEYNGEQHYNPNSFGGSTFAFTQESDKLKETYAEEQGVPLLVIPYSKSTQMSIAKEVQRAFSECVLDEIQSFTPKRIDRSHSTLEDKQELVKQKGYRLHDSIKENFTTMDKVTLVSIETGAEWKVKWFDFLNGAVPRAEEHKRRTKGSLEEKQKIADYLGYELLETDNFSVKKKVQLKDKETGEVRMLKWEPLKTKYTRLQKKALESAGLGI